MSEYLDGLGTWSRALINMSRGVKLLVCLLLFFCMNWVVGEVWGAKFNGMW